ncbi:MAG TPA: N,N-dimethylformamidase beta subunit family domain-containing protein [Gaiellaceae bacterium]|nr:N,N-dimethylformamidase beta subunit family domain-containing protein [Gaiellaceae bacterium]
MRALFGRLCPLLLMLAAAGSASAPAALAPPRLLYLTVSNGSTPFAGDTARLTTISPNRDGFRDRAVIRFSLDRPALVELQVVATTTPARAARTVWRTTRRLGRGRSAIVWRPPVSTPARTYLVRFVLTGRDGARRVYGFEPPRSNARTSGAVVRVQGVEVGFLERSYPVGGEAAASIATDARSVRLQLFSFANVPHPTIRDLRKGGTAVAPAVRLDWSPYRSVPHVVRIGRVGGFPSGLYFLRVTADDGRIGYAPLILRPRRLGEHRVAVVLSTNTWQADNFLDADGDGWGDSWNVSGTVRAIDLRRPYLDFGLSSRYRDWDLDVVSWLKRTGKQVDYLADDDLAAVAGGEELRRSYSLLVFPGHEEYVTTREYDIVQRYRDRGGRLMFLAAKNFLWKVRREGSALRRARLWRRLARPEAALVGAQWVASGRAGRARFVVRGASALPWVFAGTGLGNGSTFGRYGIAVDARAESSPPQTRVLARIPRLIGRHDAEMTFYETAAGAKVFDAGAIDFAASLSTPAVSRLVDNVWARLSG